MLLCSAAFAPQAFWSQQKIYWKKTLTQTKNKCDIGWPVISVDVPGMIKLSGLF
jgi:hypothetical protein